jgi:MoaA/NifB/PqqE/SkfB family radical SAM enzyme
MKRPDTLKLEILNDSKFIDIKQFKIILSKFRKITGVILHGGDVITHPDIFEMINECTNRKLDITLYTKANFGIDIVNKLPDDKLTLIVPIESILPELYFTINNYKLEKVYETLTYITKYKPKINLVLQPIITKDTIQTVDKIIPITRKFNATINLVYPCITSNTQEDNTPFKVDNVLRLMEHFHDIAEHFGIPVNPKTAFPTACVCEEINYYNVAINGDVYPCSYIIKSDTGSWDEYYLDDYITVPQSGYLIGNILKRDIRNLWNIDKYKTIRQNLSKYKSFEKSHPYNRDQYCIVRNTKKNKDIDYCSHCLKRWNQSC